MSALLHLKQPTLQSISIVVTLLPVVVPQASWNQTRLQKSLATSLQAIN